MISVVDRSGRMAIYQSRITKTGEVFYAAEGVVCTYCGRPLRGSQSVVEYRFYDRIYHAGTQFESTTPPCHRDAAGEAEAALDTDITVAVQAAGGVLTVEQLNALGAEVALKFSELRNIYVGHVVGGVGTEHYHARLVALGMLQALIDRLKAERATVFDYPYLRAYHDIITATVEREIQLNLARGEHAPERAVYRIAGDTEWVLVDALQERRQAEVRKVAQARYGA